MPEAQGAISRAFRLAGLIVVAATAPLRAQIGDVRDVPDPAIIKHEEHYYVFSTAPGIEIRRSRDLWEWERVGTVFDSPLPSWAQSEVPGTEFPWAPDISYFNGRCHLYYSLSTFGGQRSVIAVATNPTLDSSSPDYQWTDHGKVIESNPGRDPFNAIDPAIIVDEQDRVWMSWGSFWGGIKMRRIDPATGKLSSEDTTTYSLAARDGVDAVRGPRASQAIEGPYIIRHDDHYYLFVSFDACCRGAESTYNVRVGRSPSITGPYLDRDGKPMTESDRWAAGGHNDVVTIDGADHLVFHAYDKADEGRSKLLLREILWDEYGWPSVQLNRDRR